MKKFKTSKYLVLEDFNDKSIGEYYNSIIIEKADNDLHSLVFHPPKKGSCATLQMCNGDEMLTPLCFDSYINLDRADLKRLIKKFQDLYDNWNDLKKLNEP